MKAFGLGVAAFFTGILSVVGSEVTSFIWLDIGTMDLTGNFFLLVVVPAHLIAQGVVISLFAPLYRNNPKVYLAIHTVVAMGLYGAFLNFAANPVSDILVYEVSTLGTILFWSFVNRGRIFRST